MNVSRSSAVYYYGIGSGETRRLITYATLSIFKGLSHMTTQLPLSRWFAIALLALAVAAFVAPATRADTTPPPPTTAPVTITKYSGTVTAVDATAGTITIQKHKQTAMTFTLATNAEIKVSKAKSTLSDVQVGYEASIKSTDGKTALSVNAHPKTPKTTTKNAGAPGTPGSLTSVP